MCGSTRRQLLTKVQLPLAVPSIATGINQTINMALGIVVIAALVGAGGLGQEVIETLRLRAPGRGWWSGRDRLARDPARPGEPLVRRAPDAEAERAVVALVPLLVVGGIGSRRRRGRLDRVPRGVWDSTFADPLDDAIVWIRDTCGAHHGLNDFIVTEVFVRKHRLAQVHRGLAGVGDRHGSVGCGSGLVVGVLRRRCVFGIGLMGLWEAASKPSSR